MKVDLYDTPKVLLLLTLVVFGMGVAEVDLISQLDPDFVAGASHVTIAYIR